MAKQKRKPRGITPKQAKFCVEFLACSNASEAYRRAYNTKNMQNSTIWETACRLLQNHNVSTRLAELRQQALEAANITEQRVVEELAKLAFANKEDFYREDENGNQILDLRAATRDQMAAVSEIVTGKDGRPVKIKLADKKGALDSLGKYMGLFVDRVAHEGKDGEAIKIDTGDRELAKAVALTLQKGMK